MHTKAAESQHLRCLGVAGAQAWGRGSVQRREARKSVHSSEVADCRGETSLEVLPGNELRASVSRQQPELTVS